MDSPRPPTSNATTAPEMRLSKEDADRIARLFRAELNKAARDGFTHENTLASDQWTVEFMVSIRKVERMQEGCWCDEQCAEELAAEKEC